MRLVTLAHNLRVAGGLSVGRNIISSLSRVAHNHEHLLILPSGVGYEDVEKPRRSSLVYYTRKLGTAGQRLFEMIELPRLVAAFQPDVVWGLGNFGLVNPRGAKQAILVHKPQFVYDAAHQEREVWRQRYANKLARRRLEQSLPVTQLIFCQTETMAKRFGQAFQYQGRTAILPNAVSRLLGQDDASPTPAPLAQMRSGFRLLSVAKYYPHKNLEVLVALFRRYASRLSDVAVILTVAADQHPHAAQFLATLHEPGVRDHIINVGPVDQSELAGYYHHCDALLMPTLLESFSGTYLEAMRFGRQILTSDLDFAREVCGAAAAYFNPFDVESICETILRVKCSADLRAALVAAGRERMQRFFRDWDAIVLDAIQDLERLAGERQLERRRTPHEETGLVHQTEVVAGRSNEK